MTDYTSLTREQLIGHIRSLELQSESLTLSAERLSLLMENSSDYIMIADGKGMPILFNKAYADIMKRILNIDMKPGIQPHKLTNDPRMIAFWDNIHKRVLSGEHFSEEFNIEVPGAGERHFVFSFNPIKQNDRVVGFSEISKDITSWKRAEQALRESEARFRTAIESIPFELFTIGRDGRYIIQNSACNKLRGDIVGKTPAQVAPDRETLALWEKNNRRAFSGETIREEVKVNHPDGERWLHNIICPILEKNEIQGIVGVNIDITEQKRIQEELLRTQRLDSLGLLAGGIAHDFNNLLSGVFGFIDLARQSLNPGSQARNYLENAMDAYSLARGLTNQLLTFSRGGAPVKRVVSIEPVLRNAARLALSGSNVSVRFDVGNDLHPIEADEGQISQVINNIIINARQAMATGGTVTVRAENRLLNRDEAPGLKAGEYVEIVITDQGPGIPEQFLGKIFDPFFTTKQRGSGLGLATSYSIVNRHNGHLAAGSDPGNGAVFTILLPAAIQAEANAKTPEIFPRPEQARILIMDDEPIVLQVGKQMLESLDCEVVTAADGTEAVRQYKRAKDMGRPFDAVILDLTVHVGMNGLQAAAELRRTDPALRAIASSGYTDSPLFADYQKHGFNGILAKPYCLQDIKDVIHSVLVQSG